jgi:hypothetical protein
MRSVYLQDLKPTLRVMMSDGRVNSDTRKAEGRTMRLPTPTPVASLLDSFTISLNDSQEFPSSSSGKWQWKFRKFDLNNATVGDAKLLNSMSLHLFTQIKPICPINRNLSYTGHFQKNAALSYAYNEGTSEPTITRYTTVIRKTLKVCV